MQSSVTGFQAGRRPFIEIGHYRIHLGANQCAHNIKRVEESDSSIRLLGLRAVALCDKYPLVRSNGFCKQALILPNDVTNHSPFMHYFFPFSPFLLFIFPSKVIQVKNCKHEIVPGFRFCIKFVCSCLCSREIFPCHYHATYIAANAFVCVFSPLFLSLFVSFRLYMFLCIC